MKLLKKMTEQEDGVYVDIYAACEDNGSVICHDNPTDFGYILDSVEFERATRHLYNPETRIQMVVKEGPQQNMFTLFVRTNHNLNNQPDEFPL